MPDKQGVQFCNDELLHTIVCELPNREDFTPEDHSALWFSKAEYQSSRMEAKVISREASRYGFSKNLDGTFGEKSTTAQELLQMWCASGDSRRGLERWANHEHGQVRSKDQFQAIQIIIEAQDNMMASGDVIDHEKLRKVSHKATKTARQFARMIGKADSYAVAQEMQDGDKKIDGCETVATETTTVSSSGIARRGSDASSCCGDSVHTNSTYGTAISNPRMLLDETESKDSHRPRFRRFGFGAKQSSKREKPESATSTSSARVSRIA